jgi:Cu-Zn family superoxide dismutase
MDDLQSQPSGAAGPRVAVGVIGVANPEFKMPRLKAAK